MTKLLRIPLLVMLLVVGSLLTGCVASAPAVVVAGPPRPYYNSYYRTAPRPDYRPARVILRPAPVFARPRPVLVHPAPRYYHARPHRGYIRY